ncbi:MAG: D-tyrosyl-tRNA(Tyr) deacylase [Bacteroidales bacterium]|nr:MAG: D-tyrosyl-tRNA(Tyr) deacylase [Bacteroidales bacterium]
MRAVIQRVTEASVRIDGQLISEIGPGFMILVGIEIRDTLDDVDWLCKKIVQLRIFNDDEGIMNIPITEVDGDILAVSQFTLHGKTRKGNRPSYIHSAKPEVAIPLYDAFVKKLGELLGKPVKTGEFGAYMQIGLTNDGPVTILIDTKNKE